MSAAIIKNNAWRFVIFLNEWPYGFTGVDVFIAKKSGAARLPAVDQCIIFRIEFGKTLIRVIGICKNITATNAPDIMQCKAIAIMI